MTQIKVLLHTTQVAARITSPVLKVVVPGTQGTPGPPGADGGAPELAGLAGENLSAGRAVIQSAGAFYYFQPANPVHIGRVIGITKTSAVAGQNITVQTGGVATDASFTFPPDVPVFAGLDGELNQAPPAAGLVQKIGVSLSGTQVLINSNITLLKL